MTATRVPNEPWMQPEGSGTLLSQAQLIPPSWLPQGFGITREEHPAPYLSEERPPDAPQHGRAVPDAGIQPSRLLESTRRVRMALRDPSPHPCGSPSLLPPAGGPWCARPA